MKLFNFKKDRPEILFAEDTTGPTFRYRAILTVDIVKSAKCLNNSSSHAPGTSEELLSVGVSLGLVVGSVCSGSLHR